MEPVQKNARITLQLYMGTRMRVGGAGLLSLLATLLHPSLSSLVSPSTMELASTRDIVEALAQLWKEIVDHTAARAIRKLPRSSLPISKIITTSRTFGSSFLLIAETRHSQFREFGVKLHFGISLRSEFLKPPRAILHQSPDGKGRADTSNKVGISLRSEPFRAVLHHNVDDKGRADTCAKDVEITNKQGYTCGPKTRTLWSEATDPIIVPDNMCREVLNLTLALSTLCGEILCFVAIFAVLDHRLYRIVFALYIGASPAHTRPLQLEVSPAHTLLLQQAQHHSLSGRQVGSNVMWTVPLTGWPNTGYCAMMHFGTTEQQSVRHGRVQTFAIYTLFSFTTYIVLHDSRHW